MVGECPAKKQQISYFRSPIEAYRSRNIGTCGLFVFSDPFLNKNYMPYLKNAAICIYVYIYIYYIVYNISYHIYITILYIC